MMSRFNYSRKVLIAEFALITVGLFATWLLAWGLRIEDSGLRVLALGSTWVMDIAISLGIMVAAEMEGAIMVFYIFRLLLLLWVDSYEVGSTLLPALSCYGLFKIGTIVANGLINKEEADYRQLQQRPKFIENEQRRRDTNMFFLAFCLVGTISIGISFNPVLLLLSVGAALGVWVQLHLMSKSAGLHFRIISNTISYNLYFFLFLLAGIGKIYYQDYFYLLLPTIPYLIGFFFIGRVVIGSRSHKFHSSDQMFFQGSYIFKGDRGHKFYRHSSDSQRSLRVLDKLSRELLVIIYFLSFLASVYRENYIWLPISAYLINNYPHQDTQQPFIFNYLQAKFDVSITLRPKLTIPIAILMQALLSRETSRKEYLFDQIYQCRSATTIQSVMIYFLFGSAFLSQLMPQDLKSKTLRMLQLCSPLVCIGWAIWLQCLHLRLVLLGLYVLAYCIESISATMRARSKGGKSS